MPELPEVETTRAGIASHLQGQRIRRLRLHRRDLRWPIPTCLPKAAHGQAVRAVVRRGKYLILQLECGNLLVHLGMSGSLRLSSTDEPLRKHDHWQMALTTGPELRYHDPRRFGALLWTASEAETHPLLAALGPEPLSEKFNAKDLYASTRRRTVPIKSHIMNAHTVVGVGNIYAAEALFAAGIHPAARAQRLSYSRIERLVAEIKRVLAEAIAAGGTTLRDYVNGHDQPGYFQQQLWVYGRGGQPCTRCGTSLKEQRIGQRASAFCPKCQRR
ncbi:MAG: bifunctional DNA-formamidopyrimidine glycosylase/DNA-(apurinic or apyrimidinic site) lyase [Cellvibrionales bacterium]|nr:bifunctional DNA-formamidopyrimidine glycosylase/DNA-(apurinic or apyrimidinic site) lyase [Cellvibrionales bacterium]